jgi:hypothetical protein
VIFGEDDSKPGTPFGGQPGGGQPQQRQQQIRLDTNQMETIYANFFAMAGAPEEVTIYLGVNTPLPGLAEPLVKLSQRVLMSPSNAKRLMMALQQTVKAHEDRFGPIEVTPPQPPPQRPA